MSIFIQERADIAAFSEFQTGAELSDDDGCPK